MDACGWISTTLLASFPRVKTLTSELQLVKDVLTLSSLVEVRAEWVRPYKWSQFVLPDAAPSVFDSGSMSVEHVTGTLVDVEQLLLQNPSAKNDIESSSAAGLSRDSPMVDVIAQAQQTNGVIENFAEEHHEYEDDEEEDEEEDDVVFVLGKDAN
jgi:la-related protein 1